MLGIHFSLFPLSHGPMDIQPHLLSCCCCSTYFSHSSSLAIFFYLRRSCGLPDCNPAWTTVSQIYSQLACPFSLFPLLFIYLFIYFGGGGVLWEELRVTACWCKSHMLAHLNGLVLCFEEAVFKDFSCLQQFSLQCSFHLLPPGFPRSLRCALLKSLIAILPLVSPLRILRCTDSW